MGLNPLFESVDALSEIGTFFVRLTERSADGVFLEGEDVRQIARTLGVEVPTACAGLSITALKQEEHCCNEDGRKEQDAAPARERMTVLVTYPVSPGSGEGANNAIARKFKKCFRVCQTVAGAKVCAEVCVTIDVGWGGVHGSVKATVSVAF